MPSTTALIGIDRDTLLDLMRQAVRAELRPKGAAPPACEDTILSPKQVARMLKTNDGDVYDALRDKKLPAQRRGNRWLVRQADAARWHRDRQ